MMVISEATCEKIRALLKAGYTTKKIAETFGLREATIRVTRHK